MDRVCVLLLAISQELTFQGGLKKRLPYDTKFLRNVNFAILRFAYLYFEVRILHFNFAIWRKFCILIHFNFVFFSETIDFLGNFM